MRSLLFITFLFSSFGYGNEINLYDEAIESYESSNEMIVYYKKTKECNATVFDIDSFLETDPFKDFAEWYTLSFWVIAEDTAPSDYEQILNLVCAGANIPSFWVEGAIDRAYENFLNKSSEQFNMCQWGQGTTARRICANRD